MLRIKAEHITIEYETRTRLKCPRVNILQQHIWDIVTNLEPSDFKADK